jgi:hypothetical protein
VKTTGSAGDGGSCINDNGESAWMGEKKGGSLNRRFAGKVGPISRTQ